MKRKYFFSKTIINVIEIAVKKFLTTLNELSIVDLYTWCSKAGTSRIRKFTASRSRIQILPLCVIQINLQTRCLLMNVDM